jgi:predicted DNA-binding WGR domain protein
MTQETTYLEFSDEKSHKFYEVTLNGLAVTIRYGRIGDAGSASTKTYDTEATAQAEFKKAINSKLKKGYEPAVAGDCTKRPVLRGIARFNHLRRTAWSPIVESRKDTPLASKYGGNLWFNLQDPRATCTNCGYPKECYLQLNLQDLPAELQGKCGQGLLQVMICSHDTCGCAYCIAVADDEMATEDVRVLQPKDTESLNDEPDDSTPVLQIVGWQPFDDYPTYEEAWDVYNTEYGDEGEEEIFDSHDNVRKMDKLGGWPCFWQQFTGYPTCPVCQETMQFLFLLSRGVPGWEDNGSLTEDCPISIFQCSTHSDQLGLHMDAF